MSKKVTVAGAIIAGVLIAALFILPVFLPDPEAVSLRNALLPPGPGGLMGTDELGRSVFARLLAGVRFSLLLMAGTSLVTVGLGTLLGIVAGWLGGWPDRIVNTLITFFWSVPVAVFAVLIMTVITPSLFSILITIGLVNWVGSARVMRAEALRLRNQTFVRAARSRGCSQRDILFRELLPNLRGLLVLLLGFSAAETFALEGGLAYLGFAPPPPAATLGSLLAAGVPYFSSAGWIVFAPAVAIVAAVGSARVLSARIDEGLFR